MIRPATAEDAAALAHLAERTFRDSFADQNTAADMEKHCADRFSPSVQRHEILNPDWNTIVAEESGALVAFAQVRLNSGNTCIDAARPAELYRIYVSSEWHGRGLAQDLMHEINQIVASDSADCLWLGVWEKNPRAIAFYGKCGFEIVGEHVFKLGDDDQRDVIMSLSTQPT